MTLIFSEGQSEYDELSFGCFSGVNTPSPKRTERAEGTYPYRNTTRSQNGVHRTKKARK